MTILVAVASKHGSTRAIGDVLADEFRHQEFHVDVRRIHDVERLEAYDSVIIGSASHMGNWLPEAREYVLAHADTLRNRWVFDRLGSNRHRPAGP